MNENQLLHSLVAAIISRIAMATNGIKMSKEQTEISTQSLTTMSDGMV